MSELTNILALFLFVAYVACILAYLDPVKRDVIGKEYKQFIKYGLIPIGILIWI